METEQKQNDKRGGNEMGAIVNVEGTVTVKEKDMVNEVESLISRQVSSKDMNLTYEIVNDTTLYLHEKTSYWSESDLLDILNTILPYIKEGELAYVDKDHSHLKYLYNAENNKWEVLTGRLIYAKPDKTGDMGKDEHKALTVKDLLYCTGGNTKVEIVGIEHYNQHSFSGNEHCLWKGFVGDYNSAFPPYGHQKVEYLTVMNGTDLLKLRFNISPFSAEEQIEIENIKKYFHFCTFPDDGVERLYRRYGKKTEEYVQKHSLEDLDALIAETREVE